MLLAWTLDELLSACGVRRSDARLGATDADANARGGWAEVRHDLETPTSSHDDNEPPRNGDLASAFPWTYDCMLQTCKEVPEPRYKCCAKRCLHNLECDEPGWIEKKKTELRNIKRRNERDRSTRMALRVNRRGRVQKGKRGKPPHPVVYSAVFNQIDELLSARSACQNSRFEFVTKWFAYSQYEKKRAQAPVVTLPSASANSSAAVMFDGRICCHLNCLGRVVTGTDAVKEFFRRRDKATTQAQKQELVDTFLVTFPGVCCAATQIVLNVGQKFVQARRKRLKA